MSESAEPLARNEPNESAEPIEAFRALVWREGARLYRDLPWRDTRDAWLVLLSEVMLQQTQVKRVVNYWQRWAEAFPNADALAAASVTDVLAFWQGLGYNRRALALKRAAEKIADEHAGQLPRSYLALLELPGIGPATAAGVCIFAYDQPLVYLETNVRAVFLHHFFAGAHQVADKQLVPLIEAACDRENPRDWYYALLDYGNHLKATLPNPSRASLHHTSQSRFEGSRRQKRAFLLRELLALQHASTDQLSASLNAAERKAGRTALTAEEVAVILHSLADEGFICAVGDVWRVVA
ncbi:MAG: adenine glycosylase [Coriobacteriales bacterium]|jgi:A/G-specific adenine glycosylase|nr:adenine glycosylase [Coriobacteriales bacterium]